MLLTTCRPGHHTTLLHTARTKQDLDIPNTKPLLPPSLITLPNNKAAGLMTVESAAAPTAESQRTMTAALTSRKRRATSPTYFGKVSTMNHLTPHRSPPVNIKTASYSFDQANEPSSDLLLPHATLTNEGLNVEHIIKLSGIEQCMPRAYIRVCLAYRVPSSGINAALSRLSSFVKKTVEAKPYLAGYVVPIDGSTRSGPVEIRLLNEDYLHYPAVVVRELLDHTGQLVDYDDLDASGFPPSKLQPEKVSDLPATIADERRAPVFRAQANLLKGGIVVSLYLHHCVSDGTGLGLLTTGSIQNDDSAFKRYLEGQKDDARSMSRRLAAFTSVESAMRTNLSYGPSIQISDRNILYKRTDSQTPSNPPGRGCIISFPDAAVEKLRFDLMQQMHGTKLTRHDALQAMIWRHMVRARLPVVNKSPQIRKSKLLIPVNVRSKLRPQLQETYFGAAVDFACAEMDIATLVSGDIGALVQAARVISSSVAAVDDGYVRQAIALAGRDDPTIDVRDLLASNMNRVTGADMYITSWYHLRLYEASLDMGFGHPDWIRKPWSRDPGSCIILPRNQNKDQFEVVIQMTCADMEILLNDKEFMSYVSRVID